MSSRKPRKSQREQQQRRRQLERLKRNLKRGPFAHQRIVSSPAGMEKMSEVLERFLEPYLDLATSEDAYRKLVTLAALAWNAALMPAEKRDAMIDEVLAAGVPPDIRAQGREIVKLMMERKQAHFAQNRRFIISFEAEDVGTGYHLSVLSTLEDAPTDQAFDLPP